MGRIGTEPPLVRGMFDPLRTVGGGCHHRGMTQGSTQGSPQGPGSDRSGRTTADTVLHLFGQQVQDTPQAYAVIAGTDSLTYGQLNVRANRLAHHLMAGGLPPGAVVAIGTARRTEIVVALLAVLKAGGAYAVLD